MEKLNNELIYNIVELKEKVGTWRETGDILNVSPRTLRRWRKGKVKKTKKDLSSIRDKLKYTDESYSKTDIYENESFDVKYNLPDYVNKDYLKEQEGEYTLITLRTTDFAYRDKKGRWRVGEFAENVDKNYKGKRGRYIDYKTAKKLKRKGKKHINLVNKARQFKNQKNLNYKESFSLARDWERKYYKEREIYMEYRDKLYYKKSGLRLGEEGAILLNKYYGKNTYAKGQVLSEENREIIESMSEIPFGDLVEGLNMYIDEGFGLKPS